MAIAEQVINDNYALYLGDCIEVMKSFPNNKIYLSLYSPPFGGLYHYSSSDRDLSNCKDYSEFFEHYEYMDVPSGNSGRDNLVDFPGDITPGQLGPIKVTSG